MNEIEFPSILNDESWPQFETYLFATIPVILAEEKIKGLKSFYDKFEEFAISQLGSKKEVEKLLPDRKFGTELDLIIDNFLILKEAIRLKIKNEKLAIKTASIHNLVAEMNAAQEKLAVLDQTNPTSQVRKENLSTLYLLKFGKNISPRAADGLADAALAEAVIHPEEIPSIGESLTLTTHPLTPQVQIKNLRLLTDEAIERNPHAALQVEYLKSTLEKSGLHLDDSEAVANLSALMLSKTKDPQTYFIAATGKIPEDNSKSPFVASADVVAVFERAMSAGFSFDAQNQAIDALNIITGADKEAIKPVVADVATQVGNSQINEVVSEKEIVDVISKSFSAPNIPASAITTPSAYGSNQILEVISNVRSITNPDERGAALQDQLQTVFNFNQEQATSIAKQVSPWLVDPNLSNSALVSPFSAAMRAPASITSETTIIPSSPALFLAAQLAVQETVSSVEDQNKVLAQLKIQASSGKTIDPKSALTDAGISKTDTIDTVTQRFNEIRQTSASQSPLEMHATALFKTAQSADSESEAIQKVTIQLQALGYSANETSKITPTVVQKSRTTDQNQATYAIKDTILSNSVDTNNTSVAYQAASKTFEGITDPNKQKSAITELNQQAKRGVVDAVSIGVISSKLKLDSGEIISNFEKNKTTIANNAILEKQSLEIYQIGNSGDQNQLVKALKSQGLDEQHAKILAPRFLLTSQLDKTEALIQIQNEIAQISPPPIDYLAAKSAFQNIPDESKREQALKLLNDFPNKNTFKTADAEVILAGIKITDDPKENAKIMLSFTQTKTQAEATVFGRTQPVNNELATKIFTTFSETPSKEEAITKASEIIAKDTKLPSSPIVLAQAAAAYAAYQNYQPQIISSLKELNPETVNSFKNLTANQIDGRLEEVAPQLSPAARLALAQDFEHSFKNNLDPKLVIDNFKQTSKIRAEHAIIANSSIPIIPSPTTQEDKILFATIAATRASGLNLDSKTLKTIAEIKSFTPTDKAAGEIEKVLTIHPLPSGLTATQLATKINTDINTSLNTKSSTVQTFTFSKDQLVEIKEIINSKLPPEEKSKQLQAKISSYGFSSQFSEHTALQLPQKGPLNIQGFVIDATTPRTNTQILNLISGKYTPSDIELVMVPLIKSGLTAPTAKKLITDAEAIQALTYGLSKEDRQKVIQELILNNYTPANSRLPLNIPVIENTLNFISPPSTTPIKQNPQFSSSLLQTYNQYPPIAQKAIDRYFQNDTNFKTALTGLMGSTTLADKMMDSGLHKTVYLIADQATKTEKLLKQDVNFDRNFRNSLDLHLRYLEEQGKLNQNDLKQVKLLREKVLDPKTNLESFKTLFQTPLSEYRLNPDPVTGRPVFNVPPQFMKSVFAAANGKTPTEFFKYITDPLTYKNKISQSINQLSTIKRAFTHPDFKALYQNFFGDKKLSQFVKDFAIQKIGFNSRLNPVSGYVFRGKNSLAYKAGAGIYNRFANSAVGKAVGAAITKVATKLGLQGLLQIIGSAAPIIGNIIALGIGALIDFISKHKQDAEDAAKGGIIGGVITGGSIISGIGAAIGAVAALTITIITTIIAVFVTSIITPFLITLLSIPITIAFILYIITNSSYLSPPTNTGFTQDGGTVSGAPVLTPDPSGNSPRCWPIRRADASKVIIYQGPYTDTQRLTCTNNGVTVTCSHVQYQSQAVDLATGGVIGVIPAIATHNGVVTIVLTGDLGKHVYLAGSDVTTIYAHLDSINSNLVSGQTIGKGTIIGLIGTTGNSTGAHLHYETTPNTKLIRSYLPPGWSLFQNPSGCFADDSTSSTPLPSGLSCNLSFKPSTGVCPPINWDNPTIVGFRNTYKDNPSSNSYSLFNESWARALVESTASWACPGFVATIWAEESGGSAIGKADMGCLYHFGSGKVALYSDHRGGPSKFSSPQALRAHYEPILLDQIACIRSYVTGLQDFRTFMCQYSGEADTDPTLPGRQCTSFLNNPNFPKNVCSIGTSLGINNP